MVCKINCATIIGIDVLPVIVETDVSNGLPTFDMVGLLASDIKESKERVRTAIKNSGFVMPPKRITINFSPANIRKTGTYFDLPVAISILEALGMIKRDLSDKMFIGELSLNGDVVAVNGVLPIVLCAAEMGIKQCYVPMDNVGECDFIDDIQVIGVENLNHLMMILAMDGQEDIRNIRTVGKEIIEQENTYDFKYIKGQEQARRGAEIAAAGMHNMIMVGPPGTGKSVIAKTIPTILPDMSRDEMIEVSKIQSIMGILKEGLTGKRPFRCPHYTTTVPAMTGGGINPRPGEITMAHRGVLYMDEFAEFSKAVIETLRQPLEDRKIVVSRNGGSFEFPADFILLASMNPCRCGYYPDRNKCSCTERDVQNYTKKVSGPIMDRMDLKVYMNNVTFKELGDMEQGEDSLSIKERVNKAVAIQKERYKNEKFNFNGQLTGKNIEKYCFLGKDEREFIERIYEKMELSVRGYEKIIKVARTIADLKGNEHISMAEIAEAVSFRSA